MADKIISQLQLRSAVTDDLSFSSDDGTQSYRITAAQIRDYILALIPPAVPVGAILPFAGTAAPTGYLLCQGQAVSRVTYSALFAEIGITHGQGDGSSTFNIPDYRGRFLRGIDGIAGRDPDAASRAAMNTGGQTGNNVGSVQGHAFQTHTHIQNAHSHNFAVQGIISTENRITANFNSGSADPTNPVTKATTATNQNAAASGANSQASTGETRPVNAYVNYMIKT